MSIIIRSMTKEEFEIFYRWSVDHHAKELMEEVHLSQEDAIKITIEEVAGMLPDGLDTENSFLMSIVDGNEIGGFIWTQHEETAGRKQSFLCDFAIWESKRRRGYATQALHLMEEKAAQTGCQESVLFVADRNTAAKALYEKCGYQYLRQESYGKYMVKELQTDL